MPFAAGCRMCSTPLDAPCWLIAVAVMTLLRYDMHVDRINPGGVLAVGVAAAILQGLVGLPSGSTGADSITGRSTRSAYWPVW